MRNFVFVIAAAAMTLTPLPFQAQNYCAGTTNYTDVHTLNDVFLCLYTTSGNGSYWTSNLSPHKNAVIHLPVVFHLPPFPSTFNYLKVDFDEDNDGVHDSESDWVTFADGNEIYTVTTYTAGTKTIWYKSSDDVLHNFKFQVKLPAAGEDYSAFKPDLSISIATSSPYTTPNPEAFEPGSPFAAPHIGGGLVHVKYGQGHTGLVKPIIFVEGFDPFTYAISDPATGNLIRYGASGWDVSVQGIEESIRDFADPGDYEARSAYPATFQQLVQANGAAVDPYDIVYVDFAYGADFIQLNAEVLIKVIEWVNENKQIDASSGLCHDNIIVGASMGGLVSKYALAKMEQEGKKHRAHTYISLDSPHKGASIPLALQSIAWFLNKLERPEVKNPKLWQLLNTPAAQQMLLENIGDAVEGGRVAFGNWALSNMSLSIPNVDYQVLRNNLNAEFAGLGYPTETYNLAIANGSETGVVQPNIANEERIFNVRFKTTQNYGTIAVVSGWAMTGGQSDYVVHNGCFNDDHTISGGPSLLVAAVPRTELTDCYAWGPVPDEFDAMFAARTSEDYIHIDNAPGSTRGDLRGLYDALIQVKDNLPGSLELTTDSYSKTSSCFVPTMSALDINWGWTDANLLNNIFDAEIVKNGLTTFEDYWASNSNLKHVEITTGIRNWVFEKIKEASINLGGNTPLTTTYNFGYLRKRIETLFIANNGVLNINNNAPQNTGYVFINPEKYANKNSFVVTITSGCNPPIVTVESGGQFNIGSLDKTKNGVVIAEEEAIIHIKPGGTLHVTSNESALIIKPGARLILDPGAIVVLESSESKIRIEGTLVWNGDISFAGLGYFDFANTHTLELGPNADAFRLVGAGKDNRFIRLEGSATLYIPDEKGLDLENGAVEHHGDEIRLGTDAWCNLSNVKMYGTGTTGLYGDRVDDFIAENCTFDGLTFPIKILDATASSGFIASSITRVSNSDFNNYQEGADFRERFYVLFDNCQFFGMPNSEADYGISAEFNFLTHLRNCTISDHNSNALSGNDPLFATGASMGIKTEGGFALWMDGGEINNCDIGIGNQVLDPVNGAPANVYMNHFATIRNCHTGIVMNGNATSGLVLMDCARILEINRTGIYGKDATLVIDPLLLFQMSNGTNNVDPNVFTRYINNGPINYIDVCYEEKTPADPLPANLNFWGNIIGGITHQNSNPNASIVLEKTSTTGTPCNASFSADVFIALSTEPTGCSRDLGGTNPEDCLTAISPETTVRQAFMSGLEQINNEEFEQARSTFGAISNLWQPTLTGFTNLCETLIDAAKSLAEGEGRSQTYFKPAANLLLFPNPTSNEVTVLLPSENCTLRVWDAFGRLVQEIPVFGGSARFDVKTWHSGMYLIEAIGTSFREKARVIAQN